MSYTYFFGDLHGHYQRMVTLLRDDLRLIDSDLHWIGGADVMCFVGDYFDRGLNGIGVIDLIMRLQRQAPGQVVALLGNHDIITLAAYRFGKKRIGLLRESFYTAWQKMGGMYTDLEMMSPIHADWLAQLPAMALVSGHLVIHADSLFYTRYGSSMEMINAEISAIVAGDDMKDIDMLMEDFSGRYAFSPMDYRSGRPNPYAVSQARRMLQVFGGHQIVHGHTPVFRMTGQPPTEVEEPFVYCGGLAVNVDPGMYKGGPGFVYVA